MIAYMEVKLLMLPQSIHLVETLQCLRTTARTPFRHGAKGKFVQAAQSIIRINMRTMTS